MLDAFAYPWLLLALAAVPVLGVLGVVAWHRRRRALLALAGLVAAARLERRGGWLRSLVVSLGLTLLAVGMAGPRWGRDWNQSAAPGRDLMVVLDLSWSMFAEAPTRAGRACDALLDLAETLRRRGGHRVGLVVFAGSARLACPLTHDLDHFRDVVEAVDREAAPPGLGPGTRIGDALIAALAAHDGRTTARDVLLISDGDDPARDAEWQFGIDRARGEGVRVHCLAVGDAVTPRRIRVAGEWLTYGGKEVMTRLEVAPLREIARKTGGTVLEAGTRAVALGEFYDQLARQSDREDSPEALPVYRPRYAWFLLPAFLLLALAVWLPERSS